MLKILKNLKESILLVIAIIILLCVQAAADLNLPDFTSKIVNVGLQQGGIEEAVPDVIRESTLNDLNYFTKDDEKIQNSYELLEKNEKNIEKYPALENENIYKLKKLNKDEIQELEKIIAKPLMILTELTNESNADKIKEMLLNQSNLSSEQYSYMSQMNIMDIIKSLPEETIEEISNNLETNLNTMSESMISQAAIQEIKNEYKAIGINLENMQNNYIFLVGIQMLGVALISMLSAVSIMFLSSRVAAKLGKTLREKIFKKVLSFSTAEINAFSTA